MKIKSLIFLLIAILLQTCQPAFAIIGGVEAKNEDFARHTVYLQYQLNGKLKECNGVLVSKNYILTAAHCLQGNDLVWILDPGVRNNIIKLNFGRIHANYNQAAIYNRYDLALVRVDKSYPSYFRAVDLTAANDLFENEPLLVAGFGATDDQLMYDNVTGDYFYKGGDQILRWVWQRGFFKLSLTQSEFFFSQDNGQGVCFGDSGGPVFSIRNERLKLVGLVSQLNHSDSSRICHQEASISNLSNSQTLAWIYETLNEEADVISLSELLQKLP